MQEVSIEKKYFCSMRSGSGLCVELYGLYESEEEYSFEIQAFTSVENLIAYGKQTHIELLLISGRAMCREVRDLDIGKIIICRKGYTLRNLTSIQVCINISLLLMFSGK